MLNLKGLCYNNRKDSRITRKRDFLVKLKQQYY